MAYVYRHIRADKNIPFYIGIGSDSDGKYSRAHDCRGRNKIWVSVSQKTTYNVEILVDDLSWEEACEKEKEFIKIYGRIIDGGFLANLTFGGEGQLGMYGELNGMYGKKASDETKEKQRIKKLGVPSKMIGIKRPQHVIDAIVKSVKGKPAWNKGIPMPESTKKKRAESMVGKYKSGESHPMYGRKMPDYLKKVLIECSHNRVPWNKGMKNNYKTIPSKLKKKVLKFDMEGNFISEYESATEAAGDNKCRKSGVSACCTGRIKFHANFVWKYKQE